jgi:hypothetical protein
VTWLMWEGASGGGGGRKEPPGLHFGMHIGGNMMWKAGRSTYLHVRLIYSATVKRHEFYLCWKDCPDENTSDCLPS